MSIRGRGPGEGGSCDFQFFTSTQVLCSPGSECQLCPSVLYSQVVLFYNIPDPKIPGILTSHNYCGSPHEGLLDRYIINIKGNIIRCKLSQVLMNIVMLFNI